jgi:predicted HNH restriction endonuclease
MNKKEKQTASRQKYYIKNKKEIIKKAKERRMELRDYVIKLKESTPCKDCHKKFPFYVMDFDHRDPRKKILGIPQLVANCSKKKLLKEIKKCDIVCANCHRIRTAKMVRRKKTK